MQRTASAAAIIAFLHAAPSLRADDTSVQIFEVAAGVNGDSRVQLVQLKIAAPGPKWGPQGAEVEGRAMLAFYDAAGTETGRYVFPADPPLGLADANGFHSVLLATADFAALPGSPAPDFVLPPGLIAAGGGKICLRENPANPHFDVNLCLSHGDFAGDTEADTADPPLPAGPPAPGLPILGVRSLKRHQSFGPESFGAGQLNADFRLEPLEGRSSAGSVPSIPQATLADQGRTLFFREPFQGNGRTCLSCHLAEEAFGLPPHVIAEVLPPDDPLFVFESVPALAGLEDGALLRGGRALILENIDGFENPPLFRGSPPLINVALTAPFGLSGEFADLRVFSDGAVKQHFPRTLARNADPAAGPLDFRLPAAEELEAMEAFMLAITLDLQTDLMMASAVFRGADPAKVRRGRDVFFSDKAGCSKCHNGPALGDIDQSLVDRGLFPAVGNEKFDTGVTARSASLGLPGTHEIGREFSTRPLVGVALRSAFFHDHSVLTLAEAVDFYCTDCDDNFFAVSPAATRIGGFVFSNVEDRTAVTEFLKALVPPAPECASGLDCNANGITDSCEIALFAERDCDGDGVPDSCEVDTIDCDRNGIADACDISGNPATDCNRNGVPDSCDVGSGSSPDCNANGTPDECEPGEVLDVTDVSTLDGRRGFAVSGLRPQGGISFGLGAPGDLNGDGLDDLVVGAKSGPASPGEPESPRVFVVFGRPGLGAGGNIDVDSLDGTSGFVIEGFTPRFASDGLQVASAGDSNGDGIDDLIIGESDAAPGGRNLAGAAYVLFGSEGLGQGGSLDVSTLDGASGFAIWGRQALDRLGTSVAGPGDVDGDGLADFLVGAPFADPAGRNAAGEAYVVFGREGPASPVLDVSALDGANGFTIRGAREVDLAGSSVGAAGDVDADGARDLLVGSPGADPGGLASAGEAGVVFGGPGIGAGGFLDLGALDGANGFTIRGAGSFDTNLLLTVAGAGDVNRDGAGDVLFGAHGADPEGSSEAGAAYVVFGGPEAGAAGFVEVSGLDGTNGFSMRGLRAGDRLGSTLSGAGDVNRDGAGDFLLGIGTAREAYLVHGGGALGAGGKVDLAALGGGRGAVVRLDEAGLSTNFFHAMAVAPAGDVNGDGTGDAVSAARAPSPIEGSDPGDVIVLFGPLHAADCNSNGVPDECEVADGSSPDVNSNGVPDGCERALDRFLRGDATGEGRFDITDPINVLNCLFAGAACPPCEDATDSNDDGQVNISDPIHSLGCKFLGTACPPPPFEACGPDPTPDELGCGGFMGCP
jgi:cytochrome c peroxidase